MATREQCIRAVEDLTRTLNVSSDKSEAITKHILNISEDDADKYGCIMEAVQTTYQARLKLQSNQPIEVVLGVLNTVGAFAPVCGPEGVVLSGICGLISGFICDSIGDDGNNFQKLIDEALVKSRCSELREKAAGVGRKFTEWQIYMSNGNARLTEKDLSDLMRNYDLGTGAGFLGELLEYIKHQKTNRKDARSACELLHLIKLYCQLSITREMLLHQMYTLIFNSVGIEKRPSTIRSYWAVIGHLTFNQDLRFLHRPALNDIVLASVYIPGEWPEIAKFLKHVGVQEPAKPRPHQKLCAEKWPSSYCASKQTSFPIVFPFFYDYYFCLRARYRETDGVLLSLEETNGLLKINNAFPTKCNSNGYLSMYEKYTCWGMNGVDKTSVLYTLLSCTYYPDKFLYVTWDGFVRMNDGDPGPAGYWKIATFIGGTSV